jgi:hypothetical protein
MIQHQCTFDPSGLDAIRTPTPTQSNGHLPNEVLGTASEEFGDFKGLKKIKISTFLA